MTNCFTYVECTYVCFSPPESHYIGGLYCSVLVMYANPLCPSTSSPSALLYPLTIHTFILSNCSPDVQFLKVASHCSSTLPTLEVPQPQPTDSSSCGGEEQERGSREYDRATCQRHVQVRAAMEMCGAVMCEECVCMCSVPLYCTPCHALNTKHIV